MIRLVGRGRGEAVNRSWLIESPAPMVYRLAGDGRRPLRTYLDRSIVEALRAGARTARDVAERTGAPVGSVRNLLTRLVARGDVRVIMTDGRERIYGAGRSD